MSEVIYNPQSAYPPPNQIPSSSDNSGPKPNNRTPLIVALIIVILLMVFISSYLVFGRSVTKPVSPDIVEKNLPAGANK
jgi:hypothetical protein